jgi:alpha-L-arabinofuranosidase
VAEAAYMTSLERNGDVVHLASYAPLLAKQGRTQWRPDMIYFDNTTLLRSANYFVQQMFGQNQGDVYFASDIVPATTNLAASCVKDSGTGDLIVKLVSVSADEIQTDLKINGLEKFNPKARRTVLAGSPGANNTFANPDEIVPHQDSIEVTAADNIALPQG